MESKIDTSGLTERQAADLAEVLDKLAADPAWDHEVVVRVSKADAQ